MSLVESVVAPVLTGVSGAGASRAQDTGQGYDFAIGGLMFNVASDDQNPYQRATAQFKKDQLDTTPTPGDQSLVGYWTRGQFSFHNGAGVTYYEVEGATSIYTLRSDTVIERFRDGIGVVPFTPGQVTCARAFSADTANTYGAVTWVGSTATQYAVLDNGVVRRRNIGTATFTNDTPSTGTVVAACAGPTNVYVATTASGSGQPHARS